VPHLPDRTTAKLMNAIAEFSQNPPRELPDGVLEAIQGLGKDLSGFAGNPEASPGQREAMKVAPGTDGTGAPFPSAAKGVDGPSPGQLEHDKVVAAAEPS